MLSIQAELPVIHWGRTNSAALQIGIRSLWWANWKRPFRKWIARFGQFNALGNEKLDTICTHVSPCTGANQKSFFISPPIRTINSKSCPRKIWFLVGFSISVAANHSTVPAGSSDPANTLPTALVLLACHKKEKWLCWTFSCYFALWVRRSNGQRLNTSTNVFAQDFLVDGDEMLAFSTPFLATRTSSNFKHFSESVLLLSHSGGSKTTGRQMKDWHVNECECFDVYRINLVSVSFPFLYRLHCTSFSPWI